MQIDCLCNLGSGFQKHPLPTVGFEWTDNGFHQIYNIKCWNNFEEVLTNLSNHQSFFYVILLYDIGIEWIVARKSAEQNVLHFWLLVFCFVIHAYIYILYCILFTSCNSYVLLSNSFFSCFCNLRSRFQNQPLQRIGSEFQKEEEEKFHQIYNII